MGDLRHYIRKGHRPIWFSLVPGHRECEACLKPPSRGKPTLNIWAKAPVPF